MLVRIASVDLLALVHQDHKFSIGISLSGLLTVQALDMRTIHTIITVDLITWALVGALGISYLVLFSDEEAMSFDGR